MMSLLSCSHNDDDSAPEKPAETMTLLIAAPQGSGTRAAGDPGEAVREGEDWDELAVIIAYTELEDGPATGNLPVVVKILTKQDFERLPVYIGTTYRQLKLYLQKGRVHIYGAAYSHGADTGLDNAILACGNSTEASVRALTISNDYASGDARQTEKFLSVATGYYKDDTTGGLAEYEISKDAENGDLKPIPSMRLTRLAAKIDIQWDAQDAYTQGYTDVKVESFTFYNTTDETETGKGKGCLFPELYEGSETFAGQSVFLNTSEISKRNGRVYHYVFPGTETPHYVFPGTGTPHVKFPHVKFPHVKFKLTATKDNNPQNRDYTFQFQYKLQQAAWYKVNTTIRGVTGNATITLNN